MWNPFSDAAQGAVKGFGDAVKEVVGSFIPDPTKAQEIAGQITEKATDLLMNVMQLDERNVESARDLAAKNPTDHTPRNLAYLYTAGYFAALWACWHYGIPVEGHDVFVTLMGVLTAAQAAIMNYYFGSSHGSTFKDTVLDRIANHKGDKT